MGFLKSNSVFRGVHVLAVLLAMQVFSPILGCGGKETSSSSSSDGDPTDPDDAPPEVVNDIGFYVKVLNDKILHTMTTDGVYGGSCNIPSTATTSQDMVCRVDIQEGDLNFHDIKINYNVPPNICRYMRMTVPHYYNFEVGRGPKVIDIDITGDISGVNTITNCNVTLEDNSVQAGCAGQLEVSFDTGMSDTALMEKIQCAYKHPSTGVNCCTGDFTFIVDDGTDVITRAMSWGKLSLGCISGPGANSWAFKNSDTGFPKPAYYFTDDGLNQTWDMISPFTLKYYDNYSMANYSGSNGLNHSHNGFVDARTSTMPYAFAPIDDRDGSLIDDLQDSIKLECLDSSFEVVHRIQLYFREWNTFSEFMAFRDAAGASGNPHVGGYEDGVSCDYFLGNPELCNDVRSWDDILNLQDSNYAVTTDIYDTSPGNESQRRFWFPEEIATP